MTGRAAPPRPRGLWSDAWRRLRRNRAALAALAVIALLTLVALLTPALAPHDPNAIPAGVRANARPFWAAGHDPRFLLGTDHLARDELSRLLYGARISLVVGLVPVAIVTLAGTALGLASGWLGGRWDNLLMRLVDVVYAFPSLLFLIILQAALRETGLGKALGGLLLLFVAFAATGWTGLARLVRGEVLRLKGAEFVEAARAVGNPPWRIVWRHVLPNCLAPILVSVAFGVPGFILAEAALSFLGLGIRPPAASWGSMIYDSFGRIGSAPEFVLMPAGLIAAVMLAFTFLGDGLRDALDPWLGR